MALEVSIRVDVDTFVGARDGVPALLEALRRADVRATFLLSVGPDTAGRAVLRVLRRPGFLAKMLRTRAPGLYGLRTMLSGTLLPAPKIGRACEAQYRAVAAAGHDVGLHAWDHFAWQDRLPAWTQAEIEEEYGRGAAELTRLFGRLPAGAGAPGWVASDASLLALERLHLDWASDARGEAPFFPVVGGRRLRTLQVPVTLPTFDEQVGRGGVRPETWNDRLLDLIGDEGTHVLAVHAEVEGRSLRGEFEGFLAALLRRGARFPTLSDLARRAAPDAPACEVVQRELPGRSGLVACQGAAVSVEVG